LIFDEQQVAAGGWRRMWLTLAALAFCGLLLLGFEIGSSYQESRADARKAVRSHAELFEARFEATLRRVDASLLTVSSRLPRDLLNEKNALRYRASIESDLSREGYAFPEVAGLRVISATGQTLYLAGGGEYANVSDLDYFKELKTQATDSLVISEVITSRVTGRFSIVLARPVLSEDGRFLGAVASPIELGFYEQLFNSTNLGKGGALAIRRSDTHQLVIRHPNVVAELNKPLVPEHPVYKLITQGVRQGSLEFAAQSDRVNRIYAFQQLSQYPFYVIAGVSESELLAAWRKRAIWIGVLGAGLFICIGLVVLLLYRAHQRTWAVAQVLRKNQEEFEAAQRIAKLGSWEIRLADYAMTVSDELSRIYEVGPLTVAECHREFFALIHPEDRGKVAEEFRLAAEQRRPFAIKHRLLMPDGRIKYAQASGETEYSSDGIPLRTIGTTQDVTHQHEMEAQILHMAHHDELTGLINRGSFKASLDQALAMARRDGERLALMYLDLDRFKLINDTLGHHVGDQLLIEVARRLQAVVRESDIVARFGGDEFVILLRGVERMAAVAMVAEKVLQATGEVHLIEGRELYNTSSIGIAVFPGDGVDGVTLLKNADVAMYHSKQVGRNNFHFFDAKMNAIAGERLEIEHRLRHALARNEFCLHFQPLIDPLSGQVVSVEALLRWMHPEQGLIMPGRFIEIAEETGLIQQIGEWVFWAACRQLGALSAAGVSGVKMSINVSASQMHGDVLQNMIRHAVDEIGLQPSDLAFEITESAAMQQPDETVRILDILHGMGVQLAIDDFGTGYSSLTYLRMFPIDYLKLDQSFVNEIGQSTEGATICDATIGLAHNLGMKIVAEGVENHEQLDYLVARGCDEVQGFYFSRPLPADQLVSFIRVRNNLAPGADV
jgi:diguanylate cyclase (GGDEF)-like protein